MPDHIDRTNSGTGLVIRDIERDLNVDLVDLIVGFVVVKVVFVVVESEFWYVKGDFFGKWFRGGGLVFGYGSDVFRVVVVFLEVYGGAGGGDWSNI